MKTISAHERQAEVSRYIGEIGLDGAPKVLRHWDIQVRGFTRILEACPRAGGRIISIHNKRASKAARDHLAAHRDAGTPNLHWFSGTLRKVEQASTLDAV